MSIVYSAIILFQSNLFLKEMVWFLILLANGWQTHLREKEYKRLQWNIEACALRAERGQLEQSRRKWECRGRGESKVGGGQLKQQAHEGIMNTITENESNNALERKRNIHKRIFMYVHTHIFINLCKILLIPFILWRTIIQNPITAF